MRFKKWLLAVCGLCLSLFTVVTIGAETSAKLSQEKQALAKSLQAKGALLSFNKKTGQLRFLSNDRLAYLTVPGAQSGQAARISALAYAQAYGPLFGLRDASVELSSMRESQNAGGSSVRFQQLRQGVPVIGGELIVNMDSNHSLLSMNGEVSTNRALSLQPTIGANEARALALAAVAKWHRLSVDVLEATNPELSIYDPRLIGPGQSQARLVWRVQVKPRILKPIRELVLIDAQNGVVALHFNQVADAKNRITSNSNNTNTLPGTLVCNESSGDACSGGVNLDADFAHLYAGHTYDFYVTHHGRDSLNDAGLALRSSVNYYDGPSSCPNAFWDGAQMGYCALMSRADDVVAHELTHGVTENTSNLFYYYQSGAINESLSDIWGEFIDQTNASGLDGPSYDWQIGEDTAAAGLGVIRNMADPTLYGDPDQIISANYYTGDADNGGVHANSGVNNKAAYLMVVGGTFNGFTIATLGMTKVAKIYYQAQTQLLTSGSDYLDLYYALYQACQSLVGTAGISAGDCTEVRAATGAVEMNLEPTAGYNPEATLCTVNGEAPVNIVFYDFEADTTGWSFSPASAWQRVANFATSGSYALYAPGATGVSDKRALVQVNVPSGTSYLHFRHAFDFESDVNGNYDGGIVEYCITGACSISDSVNWTNASTLFDASGKQYGGVIASGSSSPLATLSAFVGSSHGYVSTRLNLSSLANTTVRLRWRSASDDSIASPLGWLIDEVRMYSACAATSAPNVIPTANAGIDQRVNPGSAVSLSGSGSDSNGTVSSYQWTQISGTTVSLVGGTTANASFTAPDLGTTLIFRLTVTDNLGATGVDTVTIAINSPPTVNAGANQAVALDAAVTLSGSGADSDGTISSYSWVQTSGTAVLLSGATSATATFTAPSTASTLVFQLTVTDNEGATRTDSVSIQVGATPSIGGGGGGCFIATAAYGTSMAEDVRYLRAFRDEYLQTNDAGRWFVKQYYKYSPSFADYLREHDSLRGVVRSSLSPLVTMSKALVSEEALATQTKDRP